MKKRKLLTAALLLTGSLLTAEVFWPGPGRGPRDSRSGKLPQHSFRTLLDQKSLLTEPVVYNGSRTEMHVSLLHQSLESVLAELRSRYPGLKLHVSPAGVRFCIRRGKYQEKVLLIGEGGRVTAFVMELPEPLPKCPEWPAELPLPAGAEPEEVIRLSRRGTWYGAFRNAAPHALAGTAEQASGMGFVPVTGEAARSRGTGELFTNAATGELMTVSIAADGTGTVIRSQTKK